jgi:hypothetical protein
MRNAGVFERDKILTRQTSDHIIAAIDRNPYYYANTLHGTSLTDDSLSAGYTLEYLAAILNSRLMNYVYSILTGEVGKAFAQIKIDTLCKLPICNTPNSAVAKEIGRIALQLSEGSSEEREELISRVDQLVLELYRLPHDLAVAMCERSKEIFGE